MQNADLIKQITADYPELSVTEDEFGQIHIQAPGTTAGFIYQPASQVVLRLSEDRAEIEIEAEVDVDAFWDMLEFVYS